MAKQNQKLKILYEEDGHQWYFKNADLLRKGKVKEADLEHIAEELESMGRGERKELTSYLTQLFLHLLKWKYQPAMRTGSWESSIHIHRIHSNRQISEN